MYRPLDAIDAEEANGVKYYDIASVDHSSYSNNVHHGINQTSITNALGVCCLCNSCACDCHHDKVDAHYRNNEDFVRYLFDYELFSVAHNFSRCGYLIAYLKHQGILPNACVIMADSYTLRGPYARPVIAKGNRDSQRQSGDHHNLGVNVSLSRSPTSGQLRFQRPVNLIESLVDVPDVRMFMRNYMLSGGANDWLDLRYALQMPTFLIYIKLDSSRNELPCADFTAMFSLNHLRKNKIERSIGHQLAELIAGIRMNYFNVPLPNFTAIEQEFCNMQLDQSLKNHDRSTRTHVDNPTPSVKETGASADHAQVDTSALFVSGKSLIGK